MSQRFALWRLDIAGSIADGTNLGNELKMDEVAPNSLVWHVILIITVLFFFSQPVGWF